MDFLLSKYGLIFTEFDSIDQGRATVNTFKFCKYQTIFLLSKISITVLLYSENIYERYMCSNLWSHFRILTRFHALYFGASCIHHNSTDWRHIILARFPYFLVKRTRRISHYFYLLETLISSEFGLTISGHVTVLRQWPLEKHRLHNKPIFIFTGKSF